jgi:hypothetical protein
MSSVETSTMNAITVQRKRNESTQLNKITDVKRSKVMVNISTCNDVDRVSSKDEIIDETAGKYTIT